ncbi:MAG: translocation/assembly module TamB domain-containing protein [Flavobacteriaceae bacterium]
MRTLLAALLLLIPLGLMLAARTDAQAPDQAAAAGQDQTPEEERSAFLSFVENQLSAPGRQIHIGSIQGILSSSATISEITIADDEGVWLRIVNAGIDWTRSALLLRRLDIQRLSAERIEVLRLPEPAAGAPTPEAGGFQLPELPLAVEMDELAVDRVVFGEAVFGLASEISLAGNLTLNDGSLDTALQITRLDGPGGHLELAAAFANESRDLTIDFTLDEPANGVVANLADIEGRPPIRLAVQGEGPLDEFDLKLALDAAGSRALSGDVELRRPEDDLNFTAQLGGPIARLVAPAYRPFFGHETKLTVAGTVKSGGGVRVADFGLASGALTISGNGETTADGFLRQLAVQGRLGGGTEPVVLPLPGGDKTLRRGTLDISFGGGTERWSAVADLQDLDTGTLAARNVRFSLGGRAEGLDAADARHITFTLDGAAEGLSSPQREVEEAIGTRLALSGGGEWHSGTPIHVERAALSGKAVNLTAQGDIEDYEFRGRVMLNTPALAAFSGLAGRDLAGSADLAADGTISPLTGAFDLALDGSAKDLKLGIAADRLFAGETKITGGVARGEAGITARNFRIGNERAVLSADGTYGSQASDFAFEASLADASLLSENMSGRLTARGTAKGAEGRINLGLTADMPSGALMKKKLTEGTISFNGVQEDGRLSGDIAGSAFLEGVAARLKAAIATARGETRIDGLNFNAGGAAVTGSVAQGREGLYFGNLQIEAPDISTAAALFLTEASGALNADIKLNGAEGRQNATIRADAKGLVFGDTRIGEADINAAVEDAFGVPMVEGTLSASDATISGIEIARLAANAGRQGDKTDFTASAALKNGTQAGLAGNLAPEGMGYRLNLSRFDLAQGELTARLAEPASLLVEGRDVKVDGFILDVGGGRVSASGTYAETLDLNVVIRDLPLAIGNAVMPELKLAGTVNGTARATGRRADPVLDFDLAARGITAAALRQAGLGALDIKARGRTEGDRLAVNSTIAAEGGMRATANGTVTLPRGALDLDVALERFPLDPLNRVVKGQELKGRITGTASIGGTIEEPAADFRLDGQGISAAPVAFAAPISASAEGRYGEGVLTLTSARANGAQGLSLTASGRVPVSGNGLAVRVNGSAPLTLANRFLGDRGTQLSGTVKLDASVSGSVSSPVINGQISAAGAQLVDPETNLRLNDIMLAAQLSAEQVTISRLSASVAGGGTVSGQGNVSLSAGYPANLSIALREARYADGQFVVATLSGDLGVTGPLARDPLISGAIRVERAELSIASNFGGAASRLDVKHVAPPPKVAATLKRARRDVAGAPPMPTARPAIARVDIRIDAPNRIFVRGRGLDAEVGGAVRITGPVTNIVPVGSFDLIRGRLSILGKRITFDEGNVTLIGDLDPFVNLVARNESDDITVLITVRGRVSDPAIAFSSQPALPQDEVLARLIFNRGLSELSPVQIARLAAAAAELAGGSNNSLLSSLRGAAGLDDLEIVTDAEGNTAVKAGRYVRDNVYLGVEAGANGSTRGTVNLDVTENLKARGGVGSDGRTDLGIFFEKDY